MRSKMASLVFVLLSACGDDPGLEPDPQPQVPAFHIRLPGHVGVELDPPTQVPVRIERQGGFDVPITLTVEGFEDIGLMPPAPVIVRAGDTATITLAHTVDVGEPKLREITVVATAEGHPPKRLPLWVAVGTTTRLKDPAFGQDGVVTITGAVHGQVEVVSDGLALHDSQQADARIRALGLTSDGRPSGAAPVVFPVGVTWPVVSLRANLFVGTAPAAPASLVAIDARGGTPISSSLAPIEGFAVHALIHDPRGALLVLRSDAANRPSVLRLVDDARPDVTYGSSRDGTVAAPLDAVHQMRQLPDRRVLLAGQLGTLPGLAMLTDSGTPDASFGTDGVVTISDARAFRTVAARPSGGFIAAGCRHDGFVVTFHLANGGLDTSMAQGGGRLRGRLYGLGSGCVEQVVPLADGGALLLFTNEARPSGPKAVFIARLDATGMFDATFAGGKAFCTFGGMMREGTTASLTVDGQGRAILGYSPLGKEGYEIVRLLAN